MASDVLIKKLEGVHPELKIAIAKILAAMNALGYPMMVTAGVRTANEQAALYAQGRTKKGPIVTYADGKRIKSNHQAKNDGYGHAVDCCFIVHGKPSWDNTLPWTMYGAMARLLGLKWGGDWKSLKDMPHVELPYMDLLNAD